MDKFYTESLYRETFMMPGLDYKDREKKSAELTERKHKFLKHAIEVHLGFLENV